MTKQIIYFYAYIFDVTQKLERKFTDDRQLTQKHLKLKLNDTKQFTYNTQVCITLLTTLAIHFKITHKHDHFSRRTQRVHLVHTDAVNPVTPLYHIVHFLNTIYQPTKSNNVELPPSPSKLNYVATQHLTVS